MHNQAISLFELNNLIKNKVHVSLPEHYWLRAETSDVRVNQNGHCYLEFIEKEGKNKSNIIARTRAIIWGNTYSLLKTYFETQTKQSFSSGLKVLVKVTIGFHELYGLGLVVHDIDPSYTLGDQAINRAAILQQLEEEGVLNLNKELKLPALVNRIAIISSPTAAGYEDFCNQIANNTYGFAFHAKLFKSIMQGEKVAESIIAALERVYKHAELFDTVVIIRGGGAASDLSSFDSYLLAANCAQFPLPIITGIGHERDETVIDMVAHTRTKTPTAVAEFLIDKMVQTQNQIGHIEFTIASHVEERVQNEAIRIGAFEAKTSYILKGWQKEQASLLASIKNMFSKNVLQVLKNSQLSISTIEKQVELISPKNILKKGYTLTLKDGKAIKQSEQLSTGDEILTVFADGYVKSIIK